MVGIDEVGRGAWAGPLLVCAVRLNKNFTGLKDSKQLSAKKRKLLAKEIKLSADVGYGWVSAKIIDKVGLTESMRLAIKDVLAYLNPLPDEEIIIDGTVNYLPELNTKTIIKADQTVPAVSAASIMAKVARDDYMCHLSVEFPGYGFDKHVGYGTKAHAEALQAHGVSTYHRLSFKPCKGPKND